MSLSLVDRARNNGAQATSPTANCERSGETEPTLHRIGSVRRSQGVSLKSIARHWKVSVADAQKLEMETADLTLSQLHAWQKVLDVPMVELLVDDTSTTLSPPVLHRARLVRLMKTIATLRKQSQDENVQRLVQMLGDDLVGVMPELADVGPWPEGNDVGCEGSAGECGPTVYRLPEDMLVGES